MKPEELLISTLKEYLKVHGRRIIEIASLTGQDTITISIRALFRYYTPTEKYPKLMNAINEVSREALENMGLKLEENDELKVRAKLSFIKRIVKEHHNTVKFQV